MSAPSPSAPLTLGSIIGAGLLSATTGAGLTALLFAITVLTSPQSGGFGIVIPAFLLALVIAWLLWLTGLVTLGLPCWWLLHRSAVRSPKAGAVLGAGLTFAVAGVYVLLASFPTPSRLSDSIGAWLFAAALAVIGAVAGWVLARVAYPKGARG
jgi:hypothetical protein